MAKGYDTDSTANFCIPKNTIMFESESDLIRSYFYFATVPPREREGQHRVCLVCEGFT